jgi:hypothetical protein
MNAFDIISKLNKINEENSVEVFVPSIGRKAKFKPLNIKQQKDLIKTTMDGAASGASFSQVLGSIIITNAEEDIPFKIYDRYAIIVGLRGRTISDTYNYLNKDIKISKVLEKNIKKFQQKPIEGEHTIEYDTLKIVLEIPSIERDMQVNEQFISNTKHQPKNTDYGSILGELYIYEIIKFIKSLQIDSGDNYLFESLSLKDCISIVESLPVGANSQIIEYIQKVREMENIFIELENGLMGINTSFFTRA